MPLVHRGGSMKIFKLALCTFIFCAALPAQSDRGTITGTVIDQGGAVVPNAAIAIRNSESGATFQTITTGTGNYTLASLPAGPYEITVELPGFKRYTQRGILVQVAQTERIDIKLEVGAASESVTVMAEAPLLK